jgi:hypothetical protein
VDAAAAVELPVDEAALAAVVEAAQAQKEERRFVHEGTLLHIEFSN